VPADTDRSGILYISYDGMLEPLGQSQVLAYLEPLAPDYRIHLISFEKPEDFTPPAREVMGRRLREAGISWHPQPYHRRPSALATAWDIAVGTAVAMRLAIRHRLRVVHARSYVAALMALPLKRRLGRKFIFDMRGFWADERVDGGIWPRGGRLHRTAKALERRYLLAADEVVALTHASAAEIATFPYLAERMPPVTVIPTCADLDRFTRQPTPPHPFTFGFVGAARWAMFDGVLAVFNAIGKVVPEARLLIVNRGEHDFVRERMAALGVDQDKVELAAADHRDMPKLISRMDAAAAIRKPAYSQLACAPTKLAEYLGCGVPCLVNPGIGDVVDIVEADRTGIVLHDTSQAGIEAAAAALVALAREPGISERCVAAAHRRFSLVDGVARYRALYQRLTTPRPEAPGHG
jgi:glycosyltransferase involved in cell wall biosynthesis